MKIRIPSLPPRLQALHDRWLDWVNVPVYRVGNFETRRIDIIVAFGFIFCVGYYWWSGGWQSAVIGGAMYILLALIGLWML